VVLEMRVVDSHARLFVRGFAWYLLVRIWASLRFSDTEGGPPSDLILSARGLGLRLERTETTGAVKQILAIPAYVSAEAWISGQRWLPAGFAVGKTWCSDQDCLLPLPSPDLSGVVEKRARYADSAACSRAILAGLRAPFCTGALAATSGAADELDLDELPQVWRFGEELLLLPAAVRFWTEHSDRNFLSSAAASLGEPKDRRDLLGRWAPASGDEYVRTARIVGRWPGPCGLARGSWAETA
jgi:hypothetical protein